MDDDFELESYDNHGGDQRQGLLASPSQVFLSSSKRSNRSLTIKSLASYIYTRLRLHPLLSLRKHGARYWKTRLSQVLLFLTILPTCLVLFIGVFLPSPYMRYPIWYPDHGMTPVLEGSGNPGNEKIFIAANIIDEDLIRGRWGSAVKELIYLLGSQNSFLSIYENDSGPGTKAALRELREAIKCKAIFRM